MKQITKLNQGRFSDRRAIGNIYLRMMNEYPPLSKEEQEQLVEEIVKTKSEKLCNKLFAHNLRFAITVCNAINVNEVEIPYEDLLSGAVQGLWKVIGRVRDGFYRKELGNFLTYSLKYIQGYALHEIPSFATTFKIGHHHFNAAIHLQRAEDIHFTKTGKFFSDEEKTDFAYTVFNPKLAEWVLSYNRIEFVSGTSTLLGKTDPDTLIPTETPIENILKGSIGLEFRQQENEDLAIFLEYIFSCLSYSESDILKYYFGFNELQISYFVSDIADKMNIPREKVRKRLNKAIEKISKYHKLAELKEFLEPIS